MTAGAVWTHAARVAALTIDARGIELDFGANGVSEIVRPAMDDVGLDVDLAAGATSLGAHVTIGGSLSTIE